MKMEKNYEKKIANPSTLENFANQTLFGSKHTLNPINKMKTRQEAP